MSYAVVRVQKMTRGAIKGIEIHDRREKDHSLTNPDIDFSKSGENYDLCPAQNESFSEAVQRRIEQLDLKRAVRKDAVLMAQVIVTSDGAFFDGLKDVDEDAYNAWAERRASCSHEAYISGVPFTEDYIGGLSDSPPMQADRSRQFFQDAYDFLAERYGRENVISATVHLDEATPHMHFNFVPVTPDGRLSAKDVLTKQSLTEQQTAFHEAVGAKYGLQRGEPKGSGKRRQHMETAEYKAYAAELAEARQRAETAQRATQALDSRVHVLQGDVKALEGQRERLSADLAETSQRAGEAHQRAAQEQGAVKALESRRDALRDEVGGLQREVAVLEQNRDKLLAQSPGWSLAEVKKQVEIDRKLSRLAQLERFLDAHFPRWRDLFQTFQRQQGRDRDTGRDR